MTITPRRHDALATGHASAVQAVSVPPAATATGTGMAALSLTPLVPPRAALTDESATVPKDDALPGTVPTMRRELFDRIREDLMERVNRRDLGALPPSWAGISGTLSQEEAASAVAALRVIATEVSP